MFKVLLTITEREKISENFVMVNNIVQPLGRGFTLIF